MDNSAQKSTCFPSILAIGMLVAHEGRHTQTGHGRETHLQKLTNGAEGFEDVPSLSWLILITFGKQNFWENKTKQNKQMKIQLQDAQTIWSTFHHRVLPSPGTLKFIKVQVAHPRLTKHGMQLVRTASTGKETNKNQKMAVMAAYSQTTLSQVKQLRPKPSMRKRNKDAKRKKSLRPSGHDTEMVCNLRKAKGAVPSLL